MYRFIENIEITGKSKVSALKNGFYFVELGKLGFNKLLGDGRISTKFKIKTSFASRLAIEKVKEAGGEVVVLIDTEAKSNVN